MILLVTRCQTEYKSGLATRCYAFATKVLITMDVTTAVISLVLAFRVWGRDYAVINWLLVCCRQGGLGKIIKPVRSPVLSCTELSTIGYYYYYY